MAADLAQFAIDVAAELHGGAVTSKELDELSSKLVGGGKDAEHFSEAIARVSNDLDVARVASQAASDALGEGQKRYDELERAAIKAAKAAERAGLKNQGVVPEKLAIAAREAADALGLEAKKLDELKLAASQADDKTEGLAKQLKNLERLNQRANDRLGEAASNASRLQGAFGDLGGPIGALGESLVRPYKAFADLNEAFGRGPALALTLGVGLTAVAAKLLALTAAASVAVIGLAALGVAIANTARESRLAAEAFEASDERLYGFTEAARAAQDATGLADDALRDLGKSLLEAKVSARDMPAALKAVATAEAALGKGGASDFIQQLKTGKKSVAELADEVEDKFGGIVSKKLLGFGAQMERLKRNVGRLFERLNIEPLLRGFRTLVELFGENTSAGRAFRYLLDTLFQPFIDNIETAFFKVEAFVLGFLIGLLKMRKELRPVVEGLKSLFGIEDKTTEKGLQNAKNAGESFARIVVDLIPNFRALGDTISFVASSIGFVFKVFRGLSDFLGMSLAGWILLFEDVAARFRRVWTDVTDFFKGQSLADIGYQLIRGLADGIGKGARIVVDAVRSTITDSIDPAKKLLGIASPSKVFYDIGDNTAEGYTSAIEDSSDEARAATGRLVEPPPPMAAMAGAQVQEAPTPLEAIPSPANVERSDTKDDTKTESSSNVLDFTGAEFKFYGVEGAEDAEVRFGELLTNLLKGDVAMLRGGAPA